MDSSQPGVLVLNYFSQETVFKKKEGTILSPVIEVSDLMQQHNYNKH
jgi:hypothetical protein